MRTSALVLALVSSLSWACSLERFDALAEAAPVTSVALDFPARPEAELAIALTVAADDEGRGRVLFGDGPSAIGWYRLEERGGGELLFASEQALAQLATHEHPTLTGLAVVEPGTKAVAEALVRVAGDEGAPERIVRFRVADFSRPSAPELDMLVYPWVADPAPALVGPLAAVQLDEGLPEALSGSDAGLIIWDALGSRVAAYAAAREQLLADDPSVFEADPRHGWGLTRCPELAPRAIAGGRLLADRRRAAVVLEGEILTLVGPEQPAESSLIGAPIYSCELATIELPSPAASLLVVDLERDGNDDLLVGAPAVGEVWIYENQGDGLPAGPTRVLAGDEPGGFGATLAHVELGGEAPEVILVGAPETTIGGEPEVGRVHVFRAADGELLRTLEDLEPQAGSRHGLGVHGLDLPGREELVITGARELRVHWTIFTDDPRP
ncbi:MAG: hypothetical protein R6X02_02955 [Enhygromyxa sp.]